MKRTNRVMGLAMAVLATATLGCQIASTTQAKAPSTVGTINANGGPATTLTGSSNTAGNTANAQTVGMTKFGFLGTTAQAQAALGASQGFPITAAAGGTYTTPDGLVTIVIPPGALTKDTTVRVLPINPTTSDSVPNYNVGIMFGLDLGGAYLNPDTQIKVTSKVAQSFVPNAKLIDASFSPDSYSLSQAADGSWQMTMPVRGPSTKSQTAADAPMTAAQAWLQEYGSLPVAPSINGSSNHYTTQCFVDLNAWLAAEATGMFTCGQASIAHADICWQNQAGGTGGGTITLNDGQQVSITGDKVPPPPPPPPPYTVNVHATYVSDDASVNTKVAPGAAIHFAVSGADDHGITDVATNANGDASTWARTGDSVSITSMNPIGPVAGSSGSTSGSNTVALTIPDYSPSIKIHLTSDVPLPSQVTLQYQSGSGTPQTVTVNVLSPGQSSSDCAPFYALVPSDAPIGLTLSHISGTDMIQVAAPPAQTVQRNHSYGFTFKVTTAEVK